MSRAAAPPILHLLASLPDEPSSEAVDVLLTEGTVRIERIVSRGQISPTGFWYDQAEAEWVLLISGRARLEIEGEPEPREMGPGDAVFLPPGCRHRVAWTDPEAATVWLAVFIAKD